MEPESVTPAQAALEQRVSRVLAGTAEYKAPAGLAEELLKSLDRRRVVPWWQRRVMEWPLLAQLAFALTGIVTAAALLLGRPTAPKALGVIAQHRTVLRQPAADLHATLNVLAVFHRLTDTVANSLPDGIWYGGMVLCIGAYLALFFLIVFGYRLLQAPAASR